MILNSGPKRDLHEQTSLIWARRRHAKRQMHRTMHRHLDAGGGGTRSKARADNNHGIQDRTACSSMMMVRSLTLRRGLPAERIPTCDRAEGDQTAGTGPLMTNSSIRCGEPDPALGAAGGVQHTPPHPPSPCLCRGAQLGGGQLCL